MDYDILLQLINIPDDLESASAELLLSIIESQLLRASDMQSSTEK